MRVEDDRQVKEIATRRVVFPDDGLFVVRVHLRGTVNKPDAGSQCTFEAGVRRDQEPAAMVRQRFGIFDAPVGSYRTHGVSVVLASTVEGRAGEEVLLRAEVQRTELSCGATSPQTLLADLNAQFEITYHRAELETR